LCQQVSSSETKRTKNESIPATNLTLLCQQVSSSETKGTKNESIPATKGARNYRGDKVSNPPYVSNSMSRIVWEVGKLVTPRNIWKLAREARRKFWHFWSFYRRKRCFEGPKELKKVSNSRSRISRKSEKLVTPEKIWKSGKSGILKCIRPQVSGSWEEPLVAPNSLEIPEF